MIYLVYLMPLISANTCCEILTPDLSIQETIEAEFKKCVYQAEIIEYEEHRDIALCGIQIRGCQYEGMRLCNTDITKSSVSGIEQVFKT